LTIFNLWNFFIWLQMSNEEWIIITTLSNEDNIHIKKIQNLCLFRKVTIIFWMLTYSHANYIILVVTEANWMYDQIWDITTIFSGLGLKLPLNIDHCLGWSLYTEMTILKYRAEKWVICAHVFFIASVLVTYRG